MTYKSVMRKNVQNQKLSVFRFSSRRAFTLVELLVVIAIIGALVGMLMPAVMNAQNEARRAQCTQNLQNVSTALLNFESSKNYFPGYVDTFRGTNVTWYTMILQELGEGDLYKTIATGQGSTLSETPHLAVLNCPSDSRVKCRQSYRINGGLEGAAGNDKKWRTSGLSFDLKTAKTNKIESSLKVGLSQIVDGAANTILVGENANNRADWRTATGQFQNCIMYTADTDWGSKQYVMNRSMDSTENAIKVARPSSRHKGIAIVVFADGHALSLKDSIQYNTYKMIMCPNDTGSKSLGVTFSNTIDNNYP